MCITPAEFSSKICTCCNCHVTRMVLKSFFLNHGIFEKIHNFGLKLDQSFGHIADICTRIKNKFSNSQGSIGLRPRSLSHFLFASLHFSKNVLNFISFLCIASGPVLFLAYTAMKTWKESEKTFIVSNFHSLSFHSESEVHQWFSYKGPLRKFQSAK